jgi:ABC-2 type transport system ATP-binding protein
MIQVSKIRKTYPGAGQPAVNDIDLTVAEGSFFGMLGPNGAGKTTLLSIMSGLLKADSGSLIINGADVSRNFDGVRSVIGVAPQELAIYPALSVRENLSFFGGMFGLRGAKLKSRIAECMEIAALEAVADTRAEILSGGMKRRLSLVAGLVHEPRILFLDEPTVGIDPQTRNFIYDALGRLNRLGMTLIYATHYMEEVEKMCDDVAIIDHGKIIARGTVASLLAQSDPNIVTIKTAGAVPGEMWARLLAVGADGLSVNGDTIIFKSDPRQETLVKVMEALHQHGVNIGSMRMGAKNIEEMFLSLTGTRLRDGGPP